MNTGADIDLKKLQGELAQLRDDVAKIASAVRTSLVNDSSEILSGAKECAEDVQKTIKRKLHTVTDQIEERPIASALTSFAVGLILGMVFTGRQN